jgi:signal transduction histidine kinase
MTLRAKLVALVVGVTASVLLGVGLFLSGSWSGWSRDALERELAVRAEDLAGRVEVKKHGGGLELEDEEEVFAADPSRPFRVLGPVGVVAARGELPWPPPDDGVSLVQDGRGRVWRVMSRSFEAGGHRHAPVQVSVQVAGLDASSGALESRFRRGLLLALAVALLAGGIGAAVLAHLSLGPLRRVAAEVDRFGASSLDRRLGTAGLDPELARVASAFNDLLARLEQAMQRQRAFVSRASHALRTPTATILARAEVALRRDRPSAEYREALVEVAAAARDSAALVNELLALARIDEAPAAGRDPIPLDLVAAELHRLFAPRAAEAGIALELDVSAGAAVAGNRAMLRELLEALLDNALRYTPRGGRAGVRTEPARRDEVVVTVWDTGPGIPPAERTRAFERFWRGRAAEAMGAAGSGLGLAIVKAIADAHGAAVELRDRAGGGLEVAVTFPSTPPGRLTRCEDERTAGP